MDDAFYVSEGVFPAVAQAFVGYLRDIEDLAVSRRIGGERDVSVFACSARITNAVKGAWDAPTLFASCSVWPHARCGEATFDAFCARRVERDGLSNEGWGSGWDTLGSRATGSGASGIGLRAFDARNRRHKISDIGVLGR